MGNLFDSFNKDTSKEDKETLVVEPKEEIKKNDTEIKKLGTKKTKLTDEIIEQIQLGGKTIDEEIDRPFWEFPKIEYPYSHFVPAFLMMFGDPKSGKTTIGLSCPGNILGITFEKRGNLTRPWAKIFSNSSRMQLYGVSEYIKRKTMTKYRDQSNMVYLKVCELLERATILKQKFDWVLIDGLQATQRLTTLRMKKLNDVGAFDNLPKNLLTKWGERTVYLEN